jgi:hypothetical protein
MPISLDDVFFEDEDGYEKNHHYWDLLPEEAITMSRRGKAKGYDIHRYGVNTNYVPEILVAEINRKGVQFLVLGDGEKKYLAEVEHDATRYKARRELIRQSNWILWGDLLPVNREFLLSLLWIPVDPYNAMEVLARSSQ